MNGDLIDSFAHSNPAFGAYALHWLCRGYGEAAEGRTDDFADLSPVWGMLGLALLAPATVREELPDRSSRKLSILFQENPHWRLSAPTALRTWKDPFWDSVAYGQATGVLELVGGRLRATGRVRAPTDDISLALKKKAKTLGTIMAKEESDSAIAMITGVVVEA